jgi:hypothetical protein
LQDGVYRTQSSRDTNTQARIKTKAFPQKKKYWLARPDLCSQQKDIDVDKQP